MNAERLVKAWATVSSRHLRLLSSPRQAGGGRSHTGLATGCGACGGGRATFSRLEQWISANTGDIVLLANMRVGYHFGAAYGGNHGSLTAADARVPIAFGYPGWTGDEDTTLAAINQYVAEAGVSVKEAEAMRRFFLSR